ncbi:hypothetical protein KUTeg_009447, partial [Tegillarca granosa]
MQLEIIIIMVVLAVLSGYIITSVLLLKFPIFHKRKQLKFYPKHISHRGGAGENLENTMTAFKHAYRLGTEMLELDCHITKDGKVVVTHDRFTIVKLQSESGFSKHILGGEDRKIPLLRDVFQEFPNLPINVDIKVNDDELIEKVFKFLSKSVLDFLIFLPDTIMTTYVNQLIVEYKREHITGWGNRSNIITSKLYKIVSTLGKNIYSEKSWKFRVPVCLQFSHEEFPLFSLIRIVEKEYRCFNCVVVDNIIEMNPDIPLIFSMKRVMLTLFLFYSGLLPFIPLKESLLEIIMPILEKYNELTYSSNIITKSCMDFLQNTCKQQKSCLLFYLVQQFCTNITGAKKFHANFDRKTRFLFRVSHETCFLSIPCHVLKHINRLRVESDFQKVKLNNLCYREKKTVKLCLLRSAFSCLSFDESVDEMFSGLLISPVMFKHLEKRGIQFNAYSFHIFLNVYITYVINKYFNNFGIVNTCTSKLIFGTVNSSHSKDKFLSTYLWVLNNEEEFDRAFKVGAAGVMTDFPTKLKNFLDTHPEYKSRQHHHHSR